MSSSPSAQSPDVRASASCRICEQTTLAPFLDLGSQPAANALVDESALSRPDLRFPLGLASCRTCELVQLTHVVAPEILFRHYLYFSSVSAAMVQHFAAYATHVRERFVAPGALVEGTMLAPAAHALNATVLRVADETQKSLIDVLA